MVCGFSMASDEQIAALHADPERVGAFLFPDSGDGPADCDIDKSWHAMHFLLTGEAWGGAPPLDFIGAGGTEIGDVDVGYGPARALTSAQVQAIAAALAPMTVATLFARWDPAAIRAAEIYGANPDDRAGEEEYVGSYFSRLKEFVAAAARARLGLIVYLT